MSQRANWMKRIKTLWEKKQCSYRKDRRNSYGEPDKGSRKAIRFQKRWVNQTFHSTVNQFLRPLSRPVAPDQNQTDDVENRLNGYRRIYWKKSSDLPLAQYV